MERMNENRLKRCMQRAEEGGEFGGSITQGDAASVHGRKEKMDVKKEYAFWLEDSYFDEQTKEELRGIAEDEKEIEERFCRDLEFGTGGLREE